MILWYNQNEQLIWRNFTKGPIFLLLIVTYAGDTLSTRWSRPVSSYPSHLNDSDNALLTAESHGKRNHSFVHTT